MTGAATAKARFTSSVRVGGKTRCGTSEERTASEVFSVSLIRDEVNHSHHNNDSYPCIYFVFYTVL